METDPRPTSEPDETAAAVRRAAVELHHRRVTAELESSPDRAGIDAALAGAPRPSSVVVIRIDDLPDDEDTSMLLDQIGTRLRSIVREPVGVHDLSARLDRRPLEARFVVVLPGDRYTADAVARRAVVALADPFSVRGRDLTVSARAGIAELDRDGIDRDEPAGAVRRADLATHRSSRDAS